MRFVDHPWGPLQWLLGALPARSWILLGAVNSESRSLAAFSELSRLGSLAGSRMLVVEPPASHPMRDAMLSNRIQAVDSYFSRGGGEVGVSSVELLGSVGLIQDFVKEVLDSGATSIVVDISCLPKRIFFPLLKFLLRDERPRDVLAVYASGASYARGPLYEDILPLSYLPGFLAAGASTGLSAETHDVFVGVGYDSPGLTQVVEIGSSLTYLFPFPSPPPSARRTWSFYAQGTSGS